MRIERSGEPLGATIDDIDLSKPVRDGDFKQILRALGEFGVLCLPGQRLETDAFARFGAMFGDLEINVANQFHEPGHPEVMILSNMAKDGKPIGRGDAGQGWHTDMSYSKDIALANVLVVNAGEKLHRRVGEKIHHGGEHEGPRYRGPSCFWVSIGRGGLVRSVWPRPA